MSGPLEGIRVIDWTIFQQGPIATMMLGDMGAEIIKIEERHGGDPGRGVTKILGQYMRLPADRSFYFECNNRNKKSITLDLKKEKAREVVYRLVEKSDVFVQNFRKGVAARLGVDYETLSRHNPRLIYATASGYGLEGPDSAKPTYDQVAVARSGLMHSLASPGMPPPYPITGIGDQLGGMVLAYGILLGIIARERLGVGQQIDASHLASLMWLQGLAFHAYLMLGKEPSAFDRENAYNPIFNYYKCDDGRWLFLGLTQSDRFWSSFCQAIGRQDLEKDARFRDADSREQNRVELIAILEDVFASQSSDQWLSIFNRYPDLIYGTVRTIPEVVSDPQVIANHYVVEHSHPVLGPTKMLGFPIGLTKTPGSIRMAAPEFGQHTEEVLLEVCGYTWDEIEALRREEVT